MFGRFYGVGLSGAIGLFLGFMHPLAGILLGLPLVVIYGVAWIMSLFTSKQKKELEEFEEECKKERTKEEEVVEPVEKKRVTNEEDFKLWVEEMKAIEPVEASDEVKEGIKELEECLMNADDATKDNIMPYYLAFKFQYR